jgi:GDPmannose 4,6-dehydratase
MKKTLFNGTTGQNSFYIVEFLLHKVYEVIGAEIRTSVISKNRLDHLYQGPQEQSLKFILRNYNLINANY